MNYEVIFTDVYVQTHWALRIVKLNRNSCRDILEMLNLLTNSHIHDMLFQHFLLHRPAVTSVIVSYCWFMHCL